MTVTNRGGAPTIAETRTAEEQAARDRALQLPIVRQVLATFPGAELRRVTRVDLASQEAADIAAEGAVNPHDMTQGPVAEVEEWDPFEDED